MVTYIYFVKCPNCEDEHFDFFDEAKEFALGCLSQKPIITQVEVDRNDFGECTDSADLGTVWSWEDVMGKETDAEPTKSIFTKDDLKLMADGQDPEFDNLDNSVDCEVEEPETSEVLPIERKPIPEGMTIEELVEEMEENEDTVECTWCEDLFDKSECRKEVDLGWLCSRCEMAIKSRGETLTFREGNYWDFLDESTAVQDSTMIGKYVQLVYHNSKYQEAGSPLTDFGLKRLLKTSKNCKLSSRDIDFIAKFDNRCKVIQETEDGYLVKIPYYYRDRQEHSKFEERPRYVECWVSKTNTKIINEGLSKEISAERSLEELVKDSISHLVNDIGRDSSAEDFADDVIVDLENNYDINVPEDPEKYRSWASAVACEVSRQLNNTISEDVEPEALHDLGNEYDGGYPAETPEVSDSHLRLCPECGKETFDIETGICVECGFN